jgi:acyl-CoA reductase-like NAD-dependent aldehyde dehydrogenase
MALTTSTQLLINGEWVSSSDTFPSLNPSTGECLADVAAAGQST